MLYISVVSHGHWSVIAQLSCLPELASTEGVTVCVLDNLGEEKLNVWCMSHGVDYLLNSSPQGFGENNNRVFDYFFEQGGLDIETDWFLVLNPDVALGVDMLQTLMESLDAQYPLCGVNLYKDELGEVSDDSIRNFPNFADFTSSLILGVNNTKVEKSGISAPCDVDWAAGSFLVFKADHYKKLKGFDTSYFMYCEDIDICFRSVVNFGCRVRYLPHVKVRHLAQHGNRKVFSKHFYWHVVSTLRFLWRKNSFKIVR